MDIIFSAALLIMVLVFYISNRHNKVNKWCAFAGFFFWFGVAKEAALFSVMPLLENITGTEGLQESFMPIYSFCTWALYSLAMPTSIIFSLYFYGLDKLKPKTLHLLQILVYVPALVLSLFFPPLVFRAYQLTSLPFWISYAVYNILLCAVFASIVIKTVRKEKPGKSRSQKMRVSFVIVPPIIFWTLSVFLPHLFQVEGLFSLWQINLFVVLAGVIFLFFMAFRDGFMGLKLTGETYNWDTNMNLINTGAEYTSHMLKTQTSKIELCIENLRAQYSSLESDEEEPEEFEILSRALSTLRNYMDRIRRHSQTIKLVHEPCRVVGLLAEAVMVSPLENPDIKIDIDVEDNVFWVSDKGHIIEVFANLLTNAAEAMRESGTIEITGEYGKTGYSLQIKDDGAGMPDDVVKNMFSPYFTTKNTEKNFGLGLAYCKNVIEKHGGSISAKSSQGKGTTVTIYLPAKRVAQSGIGE